MVWTTVRKCPELADVRGLMIPELIFGGRFLKISLIATVKRVELETVP